MFHSCRLQIFQTDPQDGRTEKWVIVKLLRARVITTLGTPAPNDDDQDLNPKLAAAVSKWVYGQDAFEYWGKWAVGTNYVTGRAETAYSIGSSAPQEEKFWAYSMTRRKLYFLERWEMTGDTFDIKWPLTLNDAWINGNGIFPIAQGGGSSRTGFGPNLGVMAGGSVNNAMGSGIIRAGAPVRWEGLGSQFREDRDR